MAVRGKKQGNIFDDPRYQDFVDRYHADPLKFAIECTGFIPSGDQIDLFQAMRCENARVSVGVSGFLCLGRLFQGQPNEAALCFL